MVEIKIEIEELSEYKMQFIGRVDGEVVIMSIPEVDDGQEFCEFRGRQYVANHLSTLK